MEDKHFKTSYSSYWTRFRNAFLAGILVITAIILFAYFSNGQDNFRLTLLLVLAFGTGYGLILLYHSRQFINEVKFTDDRIVIAGYNFDTPWENDLRIADSKIEIKSKGRGRGNVEYFLRVISENEHFDINRSFNWDYVSLLTIFREFKKIKGEKIVFDEKYFLDIMEKKVKGRSMMDVAFWKKIGK